MFLDDSETNWNDDYKTDIKTNFIALTSVVSHNDTDYASIESAYDDSVLMMCLFLVMLVLQMMYLFLFVILFLLLTVLKMRNLLRQLIGEKCLI